MRQIGGEKGTPIFPQELSVTEKKVYYLQPARPVGARKREVENRLPSHCLENNEKLAQLIERERAAFLGGRACEDPESFVGDVPVRYIDDILTVVKVGLSVVVNAQAFEDQEARSAPVCPSQKKFHTAVLEGVRNISRAL